MKADATVRAERSLLDRARRAWSGISAAFSLTAIALYLLLHYALHVRSALAEVPLWMAIITGGLPLLYDLLGQILKKKFGSDFLAGLSIVTATIMGDFLVVTIIVLMLSGGQALEALLQY